MTVHTHLLILNKFPKLSWATFVDIFDLMGGLLGVPLDLESCLKGPRTCSKQVSWDTQTQESCSEDTDVPSHRPLKTRGRAYMQDHSGKCQPWSGGRVARESGGRGFC